MIVYALKCRNDHHFEGWFKDSQTFDDQARARKVVCPICGNKRIEKAPMAPRLGKGAEEAAPQPSPETVQAAETMRALRRLREHVERNSDYVGERFAEEARKIHYGETEERSIYGESSPDEAKALREEGVPVHAIPWVPPHDA